MKLRDMMFLVIGGEVLSLLQRTIRRTVRSGKRSVGKGKPVGLRGARPDKARSTNTITQQANRAKPTISHSLEQRRPTPVDLGHVPALASRSFPLPN